MFDFYAEHERILPEDSVKILNILFFPALTVTGQMNTAMYRMVQLYKIRQNINKNYTNAFDGPQIYMACADNKLRLTGNVANFDFINSVQQSDLATLTKRNVLGEFISPESFERPNNSIRRRHATVSVASSDVLIVPTHDLPEKHNGYFLIDGSKPKIQQCVLNAYTHLTHSYDTTNAGFITPPHFFPEKYTTVILTSNPVFAIRANLAFWTEFNTPNVHMPILGYFNKTAATTYHTSSWRLIDNIPTKIFVINPNNPSDIRAAIEHGGLVYPLIEDIEIKQLSLLWNTIYENAVPWKRFLYQRYITLSSDYERILYLAQYGIHPHMQEYEEFINQAGIERPNINYALYPIEATKTKHSYVIQDNRIYQIHNTTNLIQTTTRAKRKTVCPYVFHICGTYQFFPNNKNIKPEIKHTVHIMYNSLNFTITLSDNELKTQLKNRIVMRINALGDKCPIIKKTNKELLDVHAHLFNINPINYKEKLGWDPIKERFNFSNFFITPLGIQKHTKLPLPTNTLLQNIEDTDTDELSTIQYATLKEHKAIKQIIDILQHLLAITICTSKQCSDDIGYVAFDPSYKNMLWEIAAELGMCINMPGSVNAWITREIKTPLRLRLFNEVNFPLFIPDEELFSQILAKNYDIQNFGVITTQNKMQNAIHSVCCNNVYNTNINEYNLKLTPDTLNAIKQLFFSVLTSLIKKQNNVENKDNYNNIVLKAHNSLKKAINKTKNPLAFEISTDRTIAGLKLIEEIDKQIKTFQIPKEICNTDDLVYTAIDVNRFVCYRKDISKELKIPTRLVALHLAKKRVFNINNTRFPCLQFNSDIAKLQNQYGQESEEI